MAKGEIGFGILGSGLVAPFHLKAILGTEGGQFIGICSRTVEKAKKLATEFGGKVYKSLDSMLKDPSINVIVITTPNQLHHEAVIMCAKAGKHVVTEKPPAMSLKDTDEMIEVCNQAGLKLACTVQSRTRHAVQAMRKAIEEGRYGTLLHGDIYAKWFRPVEYYQNDPWRQVKRFGGGVTVQQGFHYIDLLQYLMGPVKQVYSRMSQIAHPGLNIDDNNISIINYANGAQGIIQLSTAMWPGTDLRMEINGTEGNSIMVGEKMQTWTFKEERPEDEEIRNFGDSSQATGATGAADFGYKDHQVVLQDMIDAIREDHEVLIPVSTVRHSLEIALAMYLSTKENRTVNLPLESEDGIWDTE